MCEPNNMGTIATQGWLDGGGVLHFTVPSPSCRNIGAADDRSGPTGTDGGPRAPSKPESVPGSSDERNAPTPRPLPAAGLPVPRITNIIITPYAANILRRMAVNDKLSGSRDDAPSSSSRDGSGADSDADGDDNSALIAKLEQKLARMSSEAADSIQRDVRRFKRLQPQQVEYSMLRAYLELASDLPWNYTCADREAESADSGLAPTGRGRAHVAPRVDTRRLGESGAVSISAARAVLEADHCGLGPVKQRILEFLAMRNVLNRRTLQPSTALPQSKDKEGGRVLQSLRRHTADPSFRALAGPILCLVGPPGVGKTSIAASLAHCLGRPLVRIALGGVRDEAELRGHRRTYVASLPGRILTAIRRVGVCDPLILLDEVDKVGRGDGLRGDPSAALLEVLDPEQNCHFVDHYLSVPFDLSKVLFVATANSTDSIMPPLLDRMEVLRISGYTHDQKVEIARRHLVPKQCSIHGVLPVPPNSDADDALRSGTVASVPFSGASERDTSADAASRNACEFGERDVYRIAFAPDALDCIVQDYTREAGVRHLERHIASIIRHTVTAAEEGGTGGSQKRDITIRTEDVRAVLGPPTFRRDTIAEMLREHTSPTHSPTLAPSSVLTGAALGLAWTPSGGEVLVVEASAYAIGSPSCSPPRSNSVASVSSDFTPTRIGSTNSAGASEFRYSVGDGILVLTGQLGEVMRESATAALTWVRARAHMLPLRPEFAPVAGTGAGSILAGRDIHLHFPAGSVSKDGPSAGISIVGALVSLVTGLCIRADTAATGEITLSGRVSAVGGIRDKLLAAHRAGLTRVCIPYANAGDVKDVPACIVGHESVCGGRDSPSRLQVFLVDSVAEALSHMFEEGVLWGGTTAHHSESGYGATLQAPGHHDVSAPASAVSTGHSSCPAAPVNLSAVESDGTSITRRVLTHGANSSAAFVYVARSRL